MKNCGKKLRDGHPSFKVKDPIEGQKMVDLALRIEKDQILESELFHLKQYIEGNYPS